MTAVMTPELLGEYERLDSERRALGHALHTGIATEQETARFATVQQRMQELAALPPAGYTLPKQAADLVAFAKARGWLVLVQWARTMDDPFVDVQFGRRLAAGEMPQARGTTWHYRMCWHSRGCAPGRRRLFGRVLACTPENPACHDAGSLKAIRAVIAAHPNQEVTAP